MPATAAEVTLPEEFGFRSGDKGVHSSRSMMFEDLQRLLDATPTERSYGEYGEELDDENVLGKRTAVTKDHTFWKLKALYGLDPAIPVFRLLRYFWDLDAGEGRALIALLCATARDPLLRSLHPVLLRTSVGAALEVSSVEELLRETAGDRFSESTRRSIARNAAASWKASGHIRGRQRVRQRVSPTPAATAYALALGYLEGLRGTLLFTLLWARLLDAPVEVLLRRAGCTVEGAGGVELDGSGTLAVRLRHAGPPPVCALVSSGSTMPTGEALALTPGMKGPTS